MATFNLYGDITGDGAAAGALAGILEGAAQQGEETELHIFSRGGDVFEGFSLACAIKNHGGRVSAVVDGFAGSAATFPLAACRPVKMHAESLLYLHQPWILAEGYSEQLDKTAKLLRQIEQTMIDMYAARTGKPRDVVRGWMVSETYFTAAEALAAGLCDEIIPSSRGTIPQASSRYALQVMAAVRTPLPAEWIKHFASGGQTKKSAVRTFAFARQKPKQQKPKARAARMNPDEVLKKLGLAEGASSDEIIAALVKYCGSDDSDENKIALMSAALGMLKPQSEPDGDEESPKMKALAAEVSELQAALKAKAEESETPEAKAEAAQAKAKAAVAAGQWPSAGMKELVELYQSGKEPQLFAKGKFTPRDAMFTQGGHPRSGAASAASSKPNFGTDGKQKARAAADKIWSRVNGDMKAMLPSSASAK